FDNRPRKTGVQSNPQSGNSPPPRASMFRFSPVRAAQVLLFAAPTLCLGQGISTSRSTNCDIQVRVTFEDDRAAGDQLRVELLNDSDATIGNTFTDSNGRASFHVTAPVQYRVQVSGNSVQ